LKFQIFPAAKPLALRALQEFPVQIPKKLSKKVLTSLGSVVNIVKRG